MNHFDLAVVGGGIVGLAHALAAVKRGKRVVLIERDARAVGASIRNFGFVTVTGQQAGQAWERAMRSRDIWDEVAFAAGIPIIHQGLAVVARSPEALAVLEEFIATPMGAECQLLSTDVALRRFPMLRPEGVTGCLWSPHERRVESRDAIPELTAYLANLGVTLKPGVLVRTVEPPRIETTAGLIHADACVVCPGDDFLTLFPERIARYSLRRSKLHMLRLASQPDKWKLPGSVMADLSLVRYLGYAELPAAAALKAKLEREKSEALENGIHLIVVQSADGSLVVGDSHHYDDTPDPFAPEVVDSIILNCANEVLDIPNPQVIERWTGVYASSNEQLALVDRPSDAVRIVMVTSGTGASTGFAIGEEVIADLFGA
ncbi:MAG: TIGR03364 family FAD-dependent oxidoreductase [Candidatus Competibacteraceae bacterium]|jgi:FAD dependent oxidoreductase TIGR03364|nr:TIGR03364 family FAD-dependent oxidoreductase [Candidatus Competibacteraceae bacterium]